MTLESMNQDRLRHCVYGVLIAVSLATLTSRIANVQSKDRQTPFLSANDRSRWATIRALVQYGTFAIDDVIENNKPWDSIDKVRHTGRDGQLHYYSSKPPLLATLLAAQCWVIQSLTGASLSSHPFYVARTALVLTNVTSMLLFFILIVRWVERWGSTTWGRVFVVGCATWGTFLPTFAISLNNHTIAATSVMVSGYALARIWYDECRHWGYFFLAGLGSALAAANELPALSFLVAVAIGVTVKSLTRTCFAFLPPVVLIIAASVAMNYVAHGTWKPAYAQRHIQGGWYDYPGSHWNRDDIIGVDAGEPSRARYAFHSLIGHHGIFSLTPIWCMTFVGVGVMLFAKQNRRPAFALMVIGLTLLCLFFYLYWRPEADRNYGGVTSGFRWMFWFVPLWLIAMLPAADLFASQKWTRGVAILLLAVAAFSAAFPGNNPWQHPWIYQYWQGLGWIPN